VIKAYGPGGKAAVIPEAKWRRPGKKQRPSTQDLINELRRERWSLAIRPDFIRLHEHCEWSHEAD